MKKIIVGIKKELLLLINDKVGLTMMFFLPMVLVIVITSIQNSALNIVNNNQVELLILNQDNDSISTNFQSQLDQSSLFKTIPFNGNENELMEEIKHSAIPFGIVIEDGYSSQMTSTTEFQVNQIVQAFSISKESSDEITPAKDIYIKLYYNPIIQFNYASSVEKMIATLFKKQQTTYLMNRLATELELDAGLLFNADSFEESNVAVLKASGGSNDNIAPNASQHNVPAWSIFAVFFMVVSLAGNFVREKTNGSFDRILTMPSSIWYLLVSKAILFLIVSLFQISLIFLLSRFLFEHIGLPTLYLPDNLVGFIWSALLTGLTAVVYSIAIGVFSKTAEQATGFGAISIIIFAAIGGIWVPLFVMPPALQLVANVSPLHWCMELFQGIFLKNQSTLELWFPSLILIGINIIIVFFVYLKLKKLNIIT